MSRKRNERLDYDRQWSDAETKDLWNRMREEDLDDPELEGALLALTLRDESEARPPANFANTVMAGVRKADAPGKTRLERLLASAGFSGLVLVLAVAATLVEAWLVHWWAGGKTVEITLPRARDVLAALCEGIELARQALEEFSRMATIGPSMAMTLAAILLLAILTLISLPKPKEATTR
jgi:hypothetical protein